MTDVIHYKSFYKHDMELPKELVLLKQMPSMRRFDYKSITEEEARGLNGNALVWWGDGASHWFSELCDISLDDPVMEGARQIVKINIDQHPDCSVRELMDRYDSEHSEGGHLAKTGKKEGREIGLYLPPSAINVGKWEYVFQTYIKRVYDGPLDATPRDNLFYLDYPKGTLKVNTLPARAIEDLIGRKVQVTIDLDVLRNFPVRDKWITDTDCIEDDQYLEILEAISKLDIVRLDIGGIWMPSRAHELHTTRETIVNYDAADFKPRYSQGIISIDDAKRFDELVKKGDYDQFWEELIHDYGEKYEKDIFDGTVRNLGEKYEKKRKTYNNANYQRAIKILEQTILMFRHLTVQQRNRLDDAVSF